MVWFSKALGLLRTAKKCFNLVGTTVFDPLCQRAAPWKLSIEHLRSANDAVSADVVSWFSEANGMSLHALFRQLQNLFVAQKENNAPDTQHYACILCQHWSDSLAASDQTTRYAAASLFSSVAD